MNRTILLTAAILGVTSIILGAFGAHGLKALISSESVQTFETGVRYQMYHALFLLFVGSTTYISVKSKTKIFYLVVVGVLFFSGSIYGLSTNVLTSFDFKTIGVITPIGGLLLIVAWVLVFIDFLKKQN
ncbi:DUF423 domain-containing protein [Algibacter lectus]|uniref:Uncharacterized membrane protein YgdD (TMEM256/DUF423 family) n=1 Tax=Algibacter lectus TaxID=221126 RepID=A0A4R8MAH5_9FLAO|nr:DUF423 domain-containing protein [Algibacter lectus]MWW24633.1 DUF423 domain-containing protein [Algibacter lectus]TDY62653.1 uncharacterized membrane protein YgdD (TMEM256/DUF423 family) [Algibacter lectus]SFC94919.1 Uncharacterized membrane protein YgdD, TMEM256/DUF423 family [Algibacter lectus]